MMSTGQNVNALLSSVPKLDGQNYHDWKFAISMVLRRAGCWEVVSGNGDKGNKPKTRSDDGKLEKWEAAAEEGLTFIGLTIAPSQYGHIRDAADGPTAWKALADIYEKNSRATRISLKRQFYGFQHDISKPIQDYISGISTLAARLKGIGIKLDDADITDVLIFNLHDSYSNIAASLTASKDEFKLADVTGALIDEEGRRSGGDKKDDRDVALHVQERKQFKCFNCGKPGHMAKNCRAPKKTTEGKDTANATEDGVW
jgi:hypothetical protein